MNSVSYCVRNVPNSSAQTWRELNLVNSPETGSRIPRFAPLRASESEARLTDEGAMWRFGSVSQY